MAEVFLARQTGLEGFDRLCALKRILPHLVASREFVDMFLDEARLAAQLRHPNVVHIYDFGKVDESYFIAMEYVDGVAAGALIERASREPLPAVLVARIGASACAGLDHAHNLRDVEGNPLALVHRDVSPPNLLISYEGAIKLVDFGIAKAESSIESTRPGVIKGKYAYMSPEQTTGNLLDGRSDVFSLGIVLWELLAGQPAVRRDDPIEGMKMIRDGRIPPITSMRIDTPRELARAIDAALATDPAKRVSALELGLALERFIQHSEEGSSNLELAQFLRERFPRRDEPASGNTPGVTRQATMATSQLAGSVSSIENAIAAAAAPPSAERTQISPPLFPDGSPLAGPTKIAIGVETADIKPRANRAVLIAAGLGLVAAIVLTVVALSRDGSPSQPVAQPAAQVDAALELASLEVITDPPNAAVEVDGNAVNGVVSLSPGSHEIRVAAKGRKTQTRTLELVAGERRSLELALPKRTARVRANAKEDRARDKVKPATVRKTGKLRAKSSPWAEVYLGKRKLGITPLDVTLPVGKHRLRFVNPESGKKKSRTVRIKPGEQTRLSVRL